MTDAEEPLHVQVLRALGWTNIHREEYDQSGDCGPVAMNGEVPNPARPQFRTRWYGRPYGAWPEEEEQEITGIMPWLWAEILERERYQVGPTRGRKGWEACALTGVDTWTYEQGATPGEAICRLFVRLRGEKEEHE